MSEFENIIGYEKEKDELRILCDMMKHKDKYEKYGAKLPLALLLFGEPGTGKTTMAKALIAESGRYCVTCRKDKPDGSFVDEIKRVFDEARKNAPSIIFFDDLDKFAEGTWDADTNKEEFVVIQSGMDNLGDDDVFILATANDITNLPDSIKRPGRFGRKIKIEVPSLADSEKIIEYYIKQKNINTELSASVMAALLESHSCAMLESVINEAAIYAGFEGTPAITQEHIVRALRRLTLEAYDLNLDSKTNIQAVAFHEAGHAVCAALNGRQVNLLSIHRGLSSIGACKVSDAGTEIKTVPSLDSIKARVTELLAGKAAVELVFGGVDTGARTDIKEATRIVAEALDKTLAFGFEYGLYQPSYGDRHPFIREEKINEKLYSTLEECYNAAKLLLAENRELLNVIADELEEKHVLIRPEIDNILSGHELKKVG